PPELQKRLFLSVSPGHVLGLAPCISRVLHADCAGTPTPQKALAPADDVGDGCAFVPKADDVAVVYGDHDSLSFLSVTIAATVAARANTPAMTITMPSIEAPATSTSLAPSGSRLASQTAMPWNGFMIHPALWRGRRGHLPQRYGQ